jgi:ankyrin repeat protein
MVMLLLDRGAPIDARDQESGATALYHAASWGRKEAAQALLERGANGRIAAANGKTPAEAAMMNGHADVAALLRPAAGARSAPAPPKAGTPVRR